MKQLKRLCALVLAFLLITSGAQAAVKAGAACTKAGAVSTSAGKKYTCIKSGKRLVWDKGVAKAKPTPTAIPVATPTPVATPKPEIQLPVSGSLCSKIGEKVINSIGAMGWSCQ